MTSTPTTLDAAAQPSGEGLGRVAPDWHTIFLALLLVGTSAFTAHFSQNAAASEHHVATFIQTLVWEWLLEMGHQLGVQPIGISALEQLHRELAAPAGGAAR